MSETKWTPAPWHFFEPFIRARGCTVAEVIAQPDGISEANARLIALAPELAEVLDVIPEMLQRMAARFDLPISQLDESSGWLNQTARSVLAKLNEEPTR